MNDKLQVANKLLKIAQKRRDQQGMTFEQLRRQTDHYQHQLDTLHQLNHERLQSTTSGQLDSVSLQNMDASQAMLLHVFTHHQQEKALLDAECRRSKQQLAYCHSKVKGLETLVERWEKKQRYEDAKREQKRIEDVINARHKRMLGGLF